MIADALAAGTHGTVVRAWCSAGRHECAGIFYEPSRGVTYCEACMLAALSDLALALRLERARGWRRLSEAEGAEEAKRKSCQLPVVSCQ